MPKGWIELLELKTVEDVECREYVLDEEGEEGGVRVWKAGAAMVYLGKRRWKGGRGESEM